MEDVTGLDLQALMDSFPYYMFILDEDHRVLGGNVEMSRGLEDMFGELVGQRCSILMHGTDEPICDCPLAEAKRTGNAVERELVDPRLGALLTAIYPTGRKTADGKRTYVHLVRPLDG